MQEDPERVKARSAGRPGAREDVAGAREDTERMKTRPEAAKMRVVIAEDSAVVRAGLAGPVDPAARGMEMDSVATSTEPRGAMDPHRGDRVSRRRQGGADRSHRRGASGTMAQSTTGATRKRLLGIKGSTSGASISSGSGSRCKERSHAAPAWPNG